MVNRISWVMMALVVSVYWGCGEKEEKQQKVLTHLPPQINPNQGQPTIKTQTMGSPELDEASQALVSFLQYTKSPNYSKDSASAILHEARTAIDRAIQSSPNDPEVIYTHALIQIKEKNYDGAILTIEEGIKIHPNFEKFYNGLGNLYLKRGNKAKANECYDKSIALYDQLLANDPNNTSAVNKRAFALFLLGKKDEAIRFLDEKIKTSPMPAVLIQARDGYQNGYDLQGYLDKL